MNSQKCRFCSGQVRFRTIQGVVCPFHEGDYDCPTRVGNGQPDECRLTTCPICHQDVYFVRHNDGAVWFDELGKPWEKHACFIPADFHSTPAISQIEPILLVRVRDVKPLVRRNGYAVYYGRDGRASDVIDVFTKFRIPITERRNGSQSDRLRLRRRWLYIDHKRLRITTLDGRQFAFREHVFIGGWRR
jgi:hypothetical protein